MPLEISPEPTPEQRESLLRALAAQDGPGRHPGAWWEAGIREAVEVDPEEDQPLQASARPRRSAGASRA